MREQITEKAGRAWDWLASALHRPPQDQSEPETVDASRRLLLTGAAVVAATAVVGGLSSPAKAQIEFYFGGGHSRRRSYEWSHDRRRSYFDAHSRRRSRDDHSRRRSSGHGRRRSRDEYRGWNDECMLTPFGWICF